MPAVWVSGTLHRPLDVKGAREYRRWHLAALSTAHVQLVVAPRLPQAAQMKPASMSERRTPSAQRSPLIAIEWLQR
jgi:hypothetical protein